MQRRTAHGEYAVPKLVPLAIEVTALRIDNGKDGHWSSADFDVVPYQTNEGWNVFICHKGQLSTMPTILRVNEFALKRTSARTRHIVATHGAMSHLERAIFIGPQPRRCYGLTFFRRPASQACDSLAEPWSHTSVRGSGPPGAC